MLSGQQLAFFPTGLLRLEELIRRFLISRETLSIRMLDDNLDPTPLLKEIRDDKIATIIIDANASISYLILKKVSVVTFVALAHFTFIHSCPRPLQSLTLQFSFVQYTCILMYRYYKYHNSAQGQY